MAAVRTTLLLFSVLLAGCASTYTLTYEAYDPEATVCSDRFSIPRVYSGTVFDFFCLSAENAAFFCLIDMPMSLVVDTIVLPYTSYRQYNEGSWYTLRECERRIRSRSGAAGDAEAFEVHGHE
jgi:uncharacterized protein YceK